MSLVANLGDAWYPDEYWVAPPADVQRPFRYGDLFFTPATDAFDRALVNSSKRARQVLFQGGPSEPWHAVFVLSPSCDLVSKSTDSSLIQVARVKGLLSAPPDAQAQVAAGWKEGANGGQVAFASFAYLAPVLFSTSHNTPMFVDYRETVWVKYSDLKAAGRIAALDHDGRVALIRREIYYKYRWLVPMSQVRNAEYSRINEDPNYEGPKPDWELPD